MIISHQHKFVFMALPKTATHTIRVALRPILGSKDWEQCSLFEKKCFPHKQLAALGHGHISYQQLDNYIPSPFWKPYYKFCFFREPTERFLSVCFFLNRNNKKMEEAPIETITDALNSNTFLQRALVRPQSELICDESGNIMVDYVGSYQSLQTSFDFVCHQIGLPTATLQHINASAHQRNVSIKSLLNDQVLDKLNEIYARDYEIYNEYCLQAKE